MMRWDRVAMWTVFALILGFVTLAVSGLITLRLTATTDWPIGIKVLILMAIGLIFVSPFLLRGIPWRPDSTVAYVLSYVTYFLFVMVFLFFSLMILRDVIWLIGRWLCPRIPSPFQAVAVARANLGLLILVFGLSLYALYEGTKVPVLREITLYSDKIKAPLTVAVLPDIHVHGALSAKKLKGLIERTRARRPDIVLLAGDIVDDRAEALADFVPLLSELQAPDGVYVTSGNHEVYVGLEMAKDIFRRVGWRYLHNESQQVRPDVRIAGVPDIQDRRNPPDMGRTLPASSAYTILLAHTPKMFDMPHNTADLQVSGHTHGGQIFPFHLLAWLSNKYLSGLYQSGNRFLYVSRGAGQWGPQMRLLAPSEITVITILPNK